MKKVYPNAPSYVQSLTKEELKEYKNRMYKIMIDKQAHSKAREMASSCFFDAMEEEANRGIYA